MNTSAFKFLTLKKGVNLICIPQAGGGFEILGQDGVYYGWHASRDAFKALVAERGGLPAMRERTARIALVDIQPAC